MNYTRKLHSRILFLITICFISSCNKRESNYITYYQKVNEIDSIFRFANQPEIAVKEYGKLFEKYEPRNQEKIREYETYIVLADKYNIDFGGKKSIKKLIYLTAPYSVFGSGKEYYTLYKKYGIDSTEVQKEITNWKNSLDKILVDSLTIAMIRDQKYRSKEDYDKDLFMLADAKNSTLLKHIFEKYGYPSIYKAGFKGNDGTNINVRTVILHMAESKDYEYLKNKLYEFIKLGECPPEIYSEFIDRHESIFRKQILYADYGIIENLDTTLIDKNRKAIGLPSTRHKQKIGRDRHASKDLVETL